MEESQTFKTFKQLLEPTFDWGGLKEYETLVSLGQEAVYLKEVPQRILGKLASVLAVSYGEETLNNYAKEVGVSNNSLSIYRWVESRLIGLDIPADLSWTVLRYIAGTDNPQDWIDKAIKEGLSAAEIRRLIKIEKGEPISHGHKIVKCGSCGFKTEGIKCGGCGEVL